MKFSSLIYTFAILATSVFALTIPTFEDAEAELAKRQSGSFAITGVPGATQPRLEIRQLQSQQPNQYTLFVLAMQQFQKAAQTSKTGYYQIAGIHGVPSVNWDGVGRCASCTATTIDGYCTHDSILFLGWHRVYLALFEQRLVAVAKQIAAQYPASTKATMQAAAAKLRLPYWDWAARPASGSTLPAAITQAQVTVNGPSGSTTIKNPLYSYHFASTTGLKYTPFRSWPDTLRYPTSNAASATSQEQRAISAFDNIRSSLQDQVYQIFSTCDEFVEVGADVAGTSSKKCSNSWENLHNTVHTTAGGPGVKGGTSGGHMTYLSTASFDPVFWLHHANVDRFFAMWQAVYPNSYGGSQVAPHYTWTIAQGSTQNTNSPLTPFHKNTAGDFWTTAAVRSWAATFHYTYPEFSNSDGSTASINRYINGLYGPNAGQTAGSSKRAVLDSTPLAANNGSLFQYVANIATSRYALGGSYYIYIFNGNPASEEPTSWLLDPNLIGPMGVLAQDTMVGADVVTTGSIPLTRTLTDQVSLGGLVDLTPAVVAPYLESNLMWRIAGPDGKAVDPTSVPDFDISVYSSTATQVSEDQLPDWSAFIELADVTKDLASGGGSSASASASLASSTATTSATKAASTATTPTTTPTTTATATSTA